MRAKVVAFVLPLAIMGLWLLFGVPAYLDRAPEWYFQLPSVLPPTLWAPTVRVTGGILLLIAGLIAWGSLRNKKAVCKNTDNSLVVMIAHQYDELLQDSAWSLESIREYLMEKYGLSELSILRGDYEFCLDWLETHPSNQTIIIVSSLYLNNKYKAESLQQTGVAKVYRFAGASSIQLVERVEQCIHQFCTGYLS